MKTKKLKIRLATAALSAVLASNFTFVLSTPAFADNESIIESELEDILDEEEDILLDDYYYEDYSSDDEDDEDDEDEDKEDKEEENDDEIDLDDIVESVDEVSLEQDLIDESLELDSENNIESLNIENENIQVESSDNTNESQKSDAIELSDNVENEDIVIKNEDNVTKEEVQLSEDLELKLTMAIMAIEEEKSVENVNQVESDSVENNLPAKPKVAIITTKTDTEGKPLVGATLQILDSEGNVLDEWISDGTEHISMIPEGEYILREKNAPEGYKAAVDQSFNVKIEEKDINADVDHDSSHDVCWHYGGVPLYFVESEGEKEEVYCINQDWEEPNGINYDGMILDETNIRSFTPDADTTMSDIDLYNKVLDIIYHRSKVEELFPDLTETEIRFITEYALKTYTSAEVTTRQAKRDENGKLIKDEDGNLIYEDIKFLRYYRYDPTSPNGYVIDSENGDGIGKLAEHWYNRHDKTPLPPEYADLFYYLISTEDLHPDDMFLYIYSTKNLTDDGELYQNLLGVKWFDSDVEDYKTYLTVINEKVNVPPEKPHKPCYNSNVPKTGDNSHIFEYSLLMLASSVGIGASIALTKKDVKRKVKHY